MSKARREHQPVFIIIPILNSASLISVQLDAIERQTLKPHTVVFVDSGSQDNCAEVIQKEAHGKSYKVHFLSSVEKGKTSMPGRSRNTGIEFVPNDAIVAFLDMGTLPQPDWLELQLSSDEFKQNGGVMGSCLFRAHGLWAFTVCAVSYGVEAIRPSMPGSVLTKKLQLKIGALREDLRAAEDLLWKKKFISLIGENKGGPGRIVYDQFANSFWRSIKKHFLYAQHIYRAKMGKTHVFLLIFLLILGFYTWLGVLGSYFFLRGVVTPFRRSEKWFWFKQNPWALILAPLVVFLLDIARFCGYILEILRTHSRN